MSLREHSDIPYKIRAQIEDSALSVSSNIAEGFLGLENEL